MRMGSGSLVDVKCSISLPKTTSGFSDKWLDDSGPCNNCHGPTTGKTLSRIKQNLGSIFNIPLDISICVEIIFYINKLRFTFLYNMVYHKNSIWSCFFVFTFFFMKVGATSACFSGGKTSIFEFIIKSKACGPNIIYCLNYS